MLSLFQLVACLLTATAVFAWLNIRVFGLPANIGLLLMGFCASLTLIAVELLFPQTRIFDALAGTIRQIDFQQAVMQGMLAFLLFAGALQVDLNRLRSRAAVVAILATIGVLLSTIIVGAGLWFAASLLNLPVTFAWALVFGALIAPTDPVSVLSTLKSVAVQPSLETDLSGEALFNDGFAVVLFAATLQVAMGSSDGFDLSRIAHLLAFETLGGILLGLATGFVAYRALRAIDEYSTEVMISLALVTATYALAGAIAVSGPISVVVAGVVFGKHGAATVMSDVTKRYVFGFWRLTDNILNAILFLLIGLEILILDVDPSFGWMAVVAVPLVGVARFASVGGAIAILRRWHSFVQGSIPILTWGALRGGISVALALSLPDSPARPYILAATYAVVLFTVVVQGLSLGYVIRKAAPAKAEA